MVSGLVPSGIEGVEPLRRNNPSASLGMNWGARIRLFRANRRLCRGKPLSL